MAQRNSRLPLVDRERDKLEVGGEVFLHSRNEVEIFNTDFRGFAPIDTDFFESLSLGGSDGRNTVGGGGDF